ncbi:MAG: biotin attachment protein [Bradymonadaceae bacterium]|nr:biotin attachment protein [Lujinxingiaceae bacterium]
MDYLVKVDDAGEYRVQLNEQQRGVWRAELCTGRALSLELRGRTAAGELIVIVDGEQRIFRLETTSGGPCLVEAGVSKAIAVARAGHAVLEAGMLEAGSAPSGTTLLPSLRSPITGIVLEVLVEAGQRVLAGAPLVVIEAMKMENTLSAWRSGTVKAIGARAGQTVFVGEELLRVE